jgi:hypothetical protein
MDLKLEHINYPGLVLIESIGNGDCFFHCILNSVNQQYGSLSNKDKVVKAIELREYLAEKLESKTNGTMLYDTLSRGNLREMSASMPEYSLENMKRVLCSHQWVDNLFNELTSNVLNIDIYILDGQRQDLYIVGDDDEIFFKGRCSVVLYYKSGHYKLIGARERGKVTDFFHYNHPLVRALKARSSQLREQRTQQKKSRSP